MILVWAILGAAALWALTRLGRQSERRGRAQWRVAATVFAAAAFAGAALALMRGAWPAALILVAAGVWLALASRRRPAAKGPSPSAPDMSLAEARSVLGVAPGADEAAIQAAWRRLMARNHPDAGGSEGLAARLNAARDRLLRR